MKWILLYKLNYYTSSPPPPHTNREKIAGSYSCYQSPNWNTDRWCWHLSVYSSVLQCTEQPQKYTLRCQLRLALEERTVQKVSYYFRLPSKNADLGLVVVGRGKYRLALPAQIVLWKHHLDPQENLFLFSFRKQPLLTSLHEDFTISPLDWLQCWLAVQVP